MVACGSYVYVIGGEGSSFAMPDVYVAQPVGGAISLWTSTSAVPVGVQEHAVVAVDQCGTCCLYVLGGCNSGWGSNSSDVYSAPVLGGGLLGGWTSTTALPVGMAELSAAWWQDPPCSVQTFTVTPTRTPSRTRTPTPAAPQLTNTKTPTCAIPVGSVTPPFLLVNRNVFDPEIEPLQVIWAVADPSAVQVQIFDSAGEFVRQLAFQSCGSALVFRVLWDGRNYQDRLVSGNVYVLRLVSLGNRDAIERRVAVVRGTAGP